MAMIPATAALRRRAQASPEKPALTIEDQTLTRLELEVRTNRLARSFVEFGVTPDTFVTIALPNCLAYVESAIAALKLGATPQPVSGRLPDDELRAIVGLAKPSLIVGADADRFPGFKAVPPDFAPGPSISGDALPDRIAQHWKAPTSGGSTGRPKLIVSGSRAEIDENAQPFALPFALPIDDTVVVPGPLYHNAPFTFCLQGLFRGNHVVLMRRFDAVRTLQLVHQHRPSVLLLVPTMMARIWKLPQVERARYDVGSLRFAYHMGSHCPPWLKQAWIDWLGPQRILELYGGTEMQALTIIAGDEWLKHPGSVGRCLIGQMRVLSDNGKELGPGEIGEIYMRPPPGAPPTYSYVGAEAKRIGDWETLGDIGWFDAEGYLYLADRRTDLILRGGANIYPAEVEAAIDAHPAVLSSAVIGLPDDDLGQRVHAIVQASRRLAADELLAFLATKLAEYKIPGSVEFVDEPLRDDAGKLRRSALRAARLDTTTADIQ
jgi:bile acid-coenzyme A ligase